MLVACILINIRCSLDWVYRLTRISSLIRIWHSLILKSIGRIEGVRHVRWTYSDIFVSSISILVNHKSLTILISRISIHGVWVSIGRGCFILIMQSWVTLVKLFKVQMIVWAACQQFFWRNEFVTVSSRRDSYLKLLQVYIQVCDLNISIIYITTTWC